MRKTLAMVLAASCVFGLAACGGSGSDNTTSGESGAETSTEASSDDGVLKVIQPLDPGTFEPGNNDEQSYERIMLQIYDTLTRFDKDGNLQPWLADSWEWDDPTHLRVHLKEGIKFSDGSDFTAEDVIWTITRSIENNLPNAHFNMIDPAECSVVDDTTCIIGTKYACATLPNHLANGQCVIGSKKAYEESNGDYLGGAVVGTGAYKLDEYVQGDIIKLSANENYWQEGKPAFKNLEMRVVASGDARATEAKTGSYDLVLAPNSREYDNIDTTPGMHMELGNTAKTVYLLLNTKKAPMDNVKVREAFARAIDVNATVTLAYGKVGHPAEAFITPGILGSNSETYKKYFGEGHDTEAAKKLLEEAGYADGLTLEMTVESADEQRCDMAEAIQAQVADAGITLNINKMEYAPLREYISAGNHQMCIYGFTASTMEADGFLNQLQPGSDALNRVGYENQEFFDLYQQGCGTEDREERGKIWEDCLEMLMKDYVCIPLNHQQQYVAVNDRLDGVWLPQDYEELFYEDVTLKN